MTTNLRRALVTAAAAAVLLAGAGGAGCSQMTSTHEGNKHLAERRWLDTRSGFKLKLAQQHFDTGDLDQAEHVLLEALAMDPESPKLHVLAGRIAFERDQLERAYERLNRAGELDPKLSDAHYYKGIVLQRWQKYDRALEAYQQAYELQRDSAPFLLAVTDVQIALNKQDEALALLMSKKDYFDQNASIRVSIAQLHMLGKRYEQAVDYFKQASLLRPTDNRIVEELAQARLAAGQTEEAIGDLNRLLKDKEYAGRADLKKALAQAYVTVGRGDEAKQVLVDLSRQQPDDADTWLQLAEMSLSRNDLPGALTAATRVTTLARTRPEGYIIAGMVWQKRGEVQRALASFDKAAQVDPRSAEAVLLRGITLEKSGQKAAAAKAYEEALRRSPGDDRAKKLLAQVQE